jgi:hypothetical protein
MSETLLLVNGAQPALIKGPVSRAFVPLTGLEFRKKPALS